MNNIEKQYYKAFDLLDAYDNNKLIIKNQYKTVNKISYNEAMELIGAMKFKNISKIFGLEKDKSFFSSLNNIYQTFDGMEIYPSLEEKASNLLYFIVKNHSFVDGNKRIAAFIFLVFLEKNNYFLYKDISNETLVAITIMIAVSDPRDKESIIKLITNLF
jgi:death-on-curing family protein